MRFGSGRIASRLGVASLLSAALLGSSLVGPAEAAVHPEWGYTKGKPGVLKRGCHTYTYTYAVKPPPGYWAIETFLIGPGGGRLGAGKHLDGADPLTGSGVFRLCKPATRAGVFTIRTKVTSVDGGDYYEGWLPESKFRLKKPKKRR
ncbi:hypothetical protein [Nocardioides sp. SYSU D00038]|uniref:hypothetical protein n=1 Tax=Nocardioides sp. SYSU D00038 TaxID=2812554 RepID=UPI00196836EB|nr:hypothetical protein [Nocardioides sp. SYSU D00038]